MSAASLRLVTRSGHPDFLDLPWERPLETWKGEPLVEVARGIHRHVVRFVAYGSAVYALKELPPRIAEREYRLLRRLAEDGLPVVEAVGVAHRGGMHVEGVPLQDVLVTRYLDYSLPYRVLFMHSRPRTGGEARTLSDRLLDAMVMLLVRMHLSGFFWGDCSLSNTLFRRDAGALAAYIVDVETGEWHRELTRGQRLTDVELTQLNVAGGLFDLQAELELAPEPDPVETAEELLRRYEALWTELMTSELIGPDERYKIEARVRRLNELGFEVDEVEIESTARGDRLVLRTCVADAGHHRRRLLSLTGLEAQENQARSLLRDMANFRAAVEQHDGRPVPGQVAAYRWLNEVFEPTLAAIPEEQRGKLEPVEAFHGVIEHKWFLSEAAGRDVGLLDAVRSYMAEVLPAVPEERVVLAGGGDAATGWIGYG